MACAAREEYADEVSVQRAGGIVHRRVKKRWPWRNSLKIAVLQAAMRQIGGPIEVENRIIGDNTLYRVQVGNFQIEEDARHLLAKLELDYAPRLVREVLTQSSGRLEMFDQSLEQHYESTDGFRLVPEETESRMTIFGVRMNSGFSYEPVGRPHIQRDARFLY